MSLIIVVERKDDNRIFLIENDENIDPNVTDVYYSEFGVESKSEDQSTAKKGKRGIIDL